jgi:hypothetical protein
MEIVILKTENNLTMIANISHLVQFHYQKYIILIMESLDFCEDFDNSWIKEFELSEMEYSSFYKEKIESIKINYIYVDENNQIDYINQENIFIEDGKLDKDKIIDIIRINKIRGKTNYKLISILKYNITLEPDHIKKYIYDDDFNDDFLSKVDVLQDIFFKDTINLFHDLNCLYFIFCDKKLRENKHKITKKIILQLSNNNKYKKNKKTKRNIS